MTHGALDGTLRPLSRGVDRPPLVMTITDAEASFNPLAPRPNGVGILDQIGNPSWHRFGELPDAVRELPPDESQIAHDAQDRAGFWVRVCDPYAEGAITEFNEPNEVHQTLEQAAAACQRLLAEIAENLDETPPYENRLWIVRPDGSALLVGVVRRSVA